jgi:hypothetical protein
MSHPVAENYSLLVWCSQPVGLTCLTYLLDVICPLYANITIKGVVIDTQDVSAAEIEKTAIKHQVPLYDETSPINLQVDWGLNIVFPYTLPSATIKKCTSGMTSLTLSSRLYRPDASIKTPTTEAFLEGKNHYSLAMNYSNASLETCSLFKLEWLDTVQQETYWKVEQQLATWGLKFFLSLVNTPWSSSSALERLKPEE